MFPFPVRSPLKPLASSLESKKAGTFPPAKPWEIWWVHPLQNAFQETFKLLQHFVAWVGCILVIIILIFTRNTCLISIFIFTLKHPNSPHFRYYMCLLQQIIDGLCWRPKTTRQSLRNISSQIYHFNCPPPQNTYFVDFETPTNLSSLICPHILMAISCFLPRMSKSIVDPICWGSPN